MDSIDDFTVSIGHPENNIIEERIFRIPFPSDIWCKKNRNTGRTADSCFSAAYTIGKELYFKFTVFRDCVKLRCKNKAAVVKIRDCPAAFQTVMGNSFQPYSGPYPGDPGIMTAGGLV